MSVIETVRMKFKKPVKGSREQFSLDNYNGNLDLMDSLAGVQWVSGIAGRPTDNLYDGRVVIHRDTKQAFIYSTSTSSWEFATIVNGSANISVLSAAEKAALTVGQLTNGMQIFNTSTSTYEVYRASDDTWNSTILSSSPRAGGAGSAVGDTYTARNQFTGDPLGATYDQNGGHQSDYTQNGLLYYAHVNPNNNSLSAFQLKYSADDGASWTSANAPALVSGSALTNKFAIYIDKNDIMYAYWYNSGVAYLSRGVPNAGRTSWTWTLAYSWTAGGASNNATAFDFVVAPHPTIAGQMHVHMMVGVYVSNGYPTLWHAEVSFNAAGASANQKVAVQLTIPPPSTTNNQLYGLSGDFAHTGDGKTSTANPDIIFGVFHQTSSQNNLTMTYRFRYDTATQAWVRPGGTVYTVIEQSLSLNLVGHVLNVFFDGNRFMMVRFFNNVYNSIANAGVATLAFIELPRTATGDVPISFGALGTMVDFGIVSPLLQIHSGAATYDAAGNIHLVGNDYNGQTGSAASPTRYLYRRWNRATGKFGPTSTLYPTGAQAAYWANLRRGGARNGKIDIFMGVGTNVYMGYVS